MSGLTCIHLKTVAAVVLRSRLVKLEESLLAGDFSSWEVIVDVDLLLGKVHAKFIVASVLDVEVVGEKELQNGLHLTPEVRKVVAFHGKLVSGEDLRDEKI